jgi:YesN/AraC family two-component response regulator
MTSSIDMGAMTILLVDDEPFQRHLLREVLKRVGFQHVTEADSAQTALLKMAEESFNVVLSDVQMPGMNGLELLRQIRMGQTPRPRDTRFVIFTSYSNTEVLGVAMALDVNGFLAKPIRINVVIDKIERAVDEKLQLRAQTDYESVVTELSSLATAPRRVGAVLEARMSAADMINRGAAQKRLPLAQAREGMSVAKDVVAKDGTLLVRAGTVLTELIINRLGDLANVLAHDFVDIFSGPNES